MYPTLNERLDAGLALKYEWRHRHPASLTTTTPADFAALGQQGNDAKRALRMAALTPAERTAYRRGYLAAAQGASRLRALIRAAWQGLQP